MKSKDIAAIDCDYEFSNKNAVVVSVLFLFSFIASAQNFRLGLALDSSYTGPVFAHRNLKYLELGGRLLASKIWGGDEYFIDEITIVSASMGATFILPIKSTDLRLIGFYPGVYNLHTNGSSNVNFQFYAPVLNVGVSNENVEFVVGPGVNMLRSDNESIYTFSLVNAELRLKF